MPPVTVFSQTVSASGSYLPSLPIMLVDNALPLFFDLVASNGPTTINFYLEYSLDPTGLTPKWYREVDEQDIGSGVVKQSQVVRTLYLNNSSAALPDGAYTFAMQFGRRAPFARLQIQIGAGRAQLAIVAIGAQVITPT